MNIVVKVNEKELGLVLLSSLLDSLVDEVKKGGIK